MNPSAPCTLDVEPCALCLDLVDHPFPRPPVDRTLDTEHAQTFDRRIAPGLAARDDSIACLDRGPRHWVLRGGQLTAGPPLEAPQLHLALLVGDIDAQE